MDIKDELDAMLNNLKSSGQKSTKAPEGNPDKIGEVPPPVSSPAPRKSSYDSMSVDDILNALSNDSKPSETVKTEPKPVMNEKRQQPKAVIKEAPEKVQGNEDNAIPKNLLDMLSGNVASSEPAARTAKQPVVKQESEPVQKQSLEESVQAYIAEAPVAEPVLPVAEEEKAELNISTDEEPQHVEKKKKTKKKFFEKKEKKSEPKAEMHFDSEEKLAEEMAEKIIEDVIEDVQIADEKPVAVELPEKVNEISDAQPEISEEVYTAEPFIEADAEDDRTDSESEEKTDEDLKPSKRKKIGGIKNLFAKKSEVLPEPELAETESEEITESFDLSDSEYENPFEGIVSDSTEDETSALTEEKAPSASELIDAALSAIEEIQFEMSESADSDDAEEESSADELISDIRENAANTIAEISAETSVVKTPSEEESTTDDDPKPEDATEEQVNIDVNVDSQKKKSKIVSTLEQILAENPETISDERSEKAEEDEIDVSLNGKGKGKFKRRLYAFCGVIFTALAVIGLVFSINYGINHFRSFTAGEDKKDNFSDVIYPAVIMDIETFSSPSELSSEQVISAALWSLVMSADDMEKYEKTFDIISVPAIDVESYAARLFGDDLPPLTHCTVGSGELKFYFNEATKSYNVPVNPITFTYEPEIKSVSKNGNEYTLTVDYFKELPAWMKENDKFGLEISKTVEFKLVSKDDSYVISSMKIININNVA